MTDHMTPDEFRRHGRAVVDWIAGYMERVEELPVLSRLAPGEVRGKLPPHPPAAGEPARLSRHVKVKGTPSAMLAADDKLFVVTREGSIHCFGGDKVRPRSALEP